MDRGCRNRSYRIAYPETVSALDRRFTIGDLSKKEYALLMNVFGRDRLNYVVIDFDEIEAGALVRRYGLRGFDAVHLSSAKLLNDDENITLFFPSFDEKLDKAAMAEGLNVLTPGA